MLSWLIGLSQTRFKGRGLETPPLVFLDLKWPSKWHLNPYQ